MLPGRSPIERRARHSVEKFSRCMRKKTQQLIYIKLFNSVRAKPLHKPKGQHKANSYISLQALIMEGKLKCHMPKLQTSQLNLSYTRGNQKRDKLNFGWKKILKYNNSVNMAIKGSWCQDMNLRDRALN